MMVKPYKRQFQRSGDDPPGWLFTTMKRDPGPKISLCAERCDQIWPAIENSVRIRVRVSSRKFKGSNRIMIWLCESGSVVLWSTKLHGHRRNGEFMPSVASFLVTTYPALKKRKRILFYVCMTPVE